MIRVGLPEHLRTLARTGPEVTLALEGTATLGAALEALEVAYPVLRGAIRDHGTLKRRPFVRYFACGKDLSHEPATHLLPAEVVEGREPLLVIGALAGG